MVDWEGEKYQMVTAKLKFKLFVNDYGISKEYVYTNTYLKPKTWRQARRRAKL